MTGTWKTTEQSDSTCKKCGAVYKSTVTRLPAREQDSFSCTECGVEMDKWNGTHVPTYILVKKGSFSQNAQ